jgi:hypothetical protein
MPTFETYYQFNESVSPEDMYTFYALDCVVAAGNRVAMEDWEMASMWANVRADGINAIIEEAAYAQEKTDLWAGISQSYL